MGFEWLARANAFVDNMFWSGVAKHKKNPDANDNRSHPCPSCQTRPTWRGHLCVDCQEKLDLWCPCGTIAPYEADIIRQPISDYIVSEICNRCGYRIKVICEAMNREDDDEVYRLIDWMRSENLKFDAKQ